MEEREYLSKIVESQQKLYGFIKSLHYFSDEVDDILQETNVTLLKKRQNFDSSKDFLPWAFGVAKWTWMAYKQKRRRSAEKLTYCGEDFSYLVIDEVSETLEKERETSRKIKLIKEASNKLSPLDKCIFDMSRDGKKTAGISRTLDMCVSSLSARERRILQKVKKIVSNETATV